MKKMYFCKSIIQVRCQHECNHAYNNHILRLQEHAHDSSTPSSFDSAGDKKSVKMYSKQS